MKVLKAAFLVMAVIFMVSCSDIFGFRGGQDPKKKGKYTFEHCVELIMAYSGPNADDGDRHDAEMQCQACAMNLGASAKACKQMIDELEGIEEQF